ncbi:MAG: deoxyribonuclease V [Deltaproteobacteria bacterium]|nr:MAG: deoxyribonuclease V [Deltaproteobacteria bacterium]
MIFPALHPWSLTPKEAIALQRELAGRVVLHGADADEVRLVAGVDVSCSRFAPRVFAAVVLFDLTANAVVECALAQAVEPFPYVPGLLSFRELPVVLAAFRKLQRPPDVVLVDGQGLAHPRRLGIASHLGLWLDLPTIGCAKSRLCGEHAEPGPRRGEWASLSDGGEEVGRVLRTRDRVKPLFVSPGHKVGMARAAELVLACGRGYRLPEPTRLAHIESNKFRNSDEC